MRNLEESWQFYVKIKRFNQQNKKMLTYHFISRIKTRNSINQVLIKKNEVKTWDTFFKNLSKNFACEKFIFEKQYNFQKAQEISSDQLRLHSGDMNEWNVGDL